MSVLFHRVRTHILQKNGIVTIWDKIQKLVGFFRVLEYNLKENYLYLHTEIQLTSK